LEPAESLDKQSEKNVAKLPRCEVVSFRVSLRGFANQTDLTSQVIPLAGLASKDWRWPGM
tara:strand:+ start:45393 stop:45572 length:180 start_codon:yes stop_codon:yes gene_type:complete